MSNQSQINPDLFPSSQLSLTENLAKVAQQILDENNSGIKIDLEKIKEQAFNDEKKPNSPSQIATDPSHLVI